MRGILRTNLIPQNFHESAAAAIVTASRLRALPALRAGDIDDCDGLGFPARRRDPWIVGRQCPIS